MLELGKHARIINKVMMVFKTVLNDALDNKNLQKQYNEEIKLVSKSWLKKQFNHW